MTKILLRPAPKRAQTVYEVEFTSRYSGKTEKELFSSFGRAQYYANSLLDSGVAKEYQINNRQMI